MFYSLWVALSLAYAAPSEPRIGRHAPADICFQSGPPEGWEFVRVFVSKNPTRELDLGWSYRAQGVVVTFYAFPEASTADASLQRAVDAVGLAAGAVQRAKWGELMSIEVPSLEGQGAILHGARVIGDPSEGEERVSQELVAAWSFAPWTLKIRASWTDPKVSPVQILAAILPWGAMPCGDLPRAHAGIVNVKREMKGPL